jgi:ferrous iron transport protein B
MKVALLGNPNTGKSSVFNMLTGLRQHVGNFPGVTVDKKHAKFNFQGEKIELIDFPGTYSIYPRSKDEEVVYENLVRADMQDHPDAVAVVVDASNIERNLLLFSQVYDLQLPTLLILNMVDLASRKQLEVDIDELQARFPEATIVRSNARIKSGKEGILGALLQLKERKGDTFHDTPLCDEFDTQAQEIETRERYAKIRAITDKIVRSKAQDDRTSKIDRLLVHPILGYLFFGLVLVVIFQFIYVISSVPMDLIDSAFANLSAWSASVLPQGIFTDLLTQGIIPGIGGVVIFIPQIALLFLFMGILEESGYLARVVFIMDRIMRPLGLNGKSVVPLMSSVACAIPGVMAARTISDWKERLTTIMVAPLMSCSARIPVYTLLITLVIPEQTVFGFMNLQGLVLFALYFLGTFMALLVAVVLKFLIKRRQTGFLLLEMPSYKMPRASTLGLLVWEKVKVFVLDAGKIILAISIVLWALASFGPSDRMEQAGEKAQLIAEQNNLLEEETEHLIGSKKLEQSYIGIMGRTIEPVIEPLGYDWKIGIALITSFAAREVFVGSMATIYAVQDDGENNLPLIEKMHAEKDNQGQPVYTLATGLSLMVFYAFAMMCMATLAVVKRETKSWKWPLIQLGYMGALAYFGALITYQLFV